MSVNQVQSFRGFIKGVNNTFKRERDRFFTLNSSSVDSMIYATALNEKAELLTQDNDLEGLENVQYFVHPNLK